MNRVICAFVEKLNPQNCHSVSKIPADFWKSKSILHKILKACPESWEHICEKSRQDHGIVSLAFLYLSNSVTAPFKDNRDFAKALLKSSLYWEEHNELRIYIVQENIQKAFNFISFDFLSDKTFLQEVLIENKNLGDIMFSSFPKKIQEDRQFIVECLTKTPQSVTSDINSARFCRFLPETLKSDEAFLLELIKINPHVFYFLPDSDRGFALKAYQANRLVYEYLDPRAKNEIYSKHL